MKPFNVLDRALPIHHNYLIEASAGTGKTFSIQNIFVRLLIERPAIPLSKILVVTFTKAATRDLLVRIRKNIEDILSCINQWLEDEKADPNAPDYLQAIFERGEQAAQEAKRALEYALFTFDQPSIFTIHSFCSRMLKQYAIEADMGFHANEGITPLAKRELKQIIRDYFRSELHEDIISPAQMAIYLNNDAEQKELQNALSAMNVFVLPPTYKEMFDQFVKAFSRLKNDAGYGITSAKILGEFDRQVGNYKAKKNWTVEERLSWAERFAALFDKEQIEKEDFEWLIEEGLLWNEFFDADLLKNKISGSLDSTLNQKIKTDLEPIISQARDFSTLLVRLAHDCLQYFKRYQNEEERMSPDDLLLKMDAALQQTSFACAVRKDFQAAIIDEFQDTDPLQWQIFKKLFLPKESKWNGYLYLVGDPKQSIYSFRQADIYTYLNAAEALGKESHLTLNVNYRSQPLLVNALNTLFDPIHLPRLMPLPKLGQQLTYRPVKAAPHHLPFQDMRGAVHFFCSEGDKKVDHESAVFFPFIVQEILRLKCDKQFKFSQFAILVRNHSQAKALTEFLNLHHIPFVNQKGSNLAESDALIGLVHLLQAVLHPQDKSAFKIALGSPLLGWTWSEMQQGIPIEEMMVKILQLQRELIENGFSSFFEKLLQSSWKNDGLTVQTRILGQEHGLELFHDLQQIADVIVEHQFNGWNTPEGLISFLDDFEDWAEDEDERVIRMQNPGKEGVKVITMHYSKGLEFDVVFALGLVNKESKTARFITFENNGKTLKIPARKDSAEWLMYCQEIDAEKMRQLYVALTRAKYQIYIPVILSPRKMEYGQASPIDLFLAGLQQSESDYANIYQRINQGTGSQLIQFLEEIGKSNSISYSIHQAIELQSNEEDFEIDPVLIKPGSVCVRGDPLIITSFTGIARHQVVEKPENLYSITPPHDIENPIKHIHTLPANSTTGIFLHEIMERIEFSKWSDCRSPGDGLDYLKSFLHSSLYHQWEHSFAELVFNTLKTPLAIHENRFCLADLLSTQIYREMPFLYPGKGAKAVEGIVHENGLIKGVIDLIFLFNGKYYIVDWKSNWLGDNRDSYRQPNLHQAMVENSYLLQAEIYKEALKRYLAIVDKRPFDDCFGGIFYLFLRGMSPDHSTGIYQI